MRKDAFGVLETFSSGRGGGEDGGAEGLVVGGEGLCAVEDGETARGVYLGGG